MTRPLLPSALVPPFVALMSVALVSAVSGTAALAQVSVNPGALDQLKPSAPSAAARPAPAAAPATHPALRRPAAPAHAAGRPSHTAPAAASPPKPKPRPVTIAPAAPPAAVLPPPVEAPRPAAVPPPPPIPVVPDAAGEFTPIPGGVRITFGAGTSDVNQNNLNAMREVAREVKADPNTDLNVVAYAAGPADDPSTSRRLSLSRALAARAVLISEGIPSTRIYVRALGSASGDGPADRVDLVRAGTQAADPKAQATQPAPQPAPRKP